MRASSRRPRNCSALHTVCNTCADPAAGPAGGLGDAAGGGAVSAKLFAPGRNNSIAASAAPIVRARHRHGDWRLRC
jgi:hypothetical protein